VEKVSLKSYPIEILADNFSELTPVAIKDNVEFLANPGFSISFNSDKVVERVFSQHSKTVDDLCEVNQAIALSGDKSASLRDSNHAGKFYKLLDGRNIGKYSIHWDGVYLDYNISRIHSCKRKDIFQSPEKLFFRRVSENLMFTYDDEQYFALNTLVVVNLKKQVPGQLKFLLGVLNSRLMNYLYKRKFKSTKTVFSEIQARTVRQLPIPSVDASAETSIAKLVDRILSKKRGNPTADTRGLEQEIDQRVYALYGLTPEEIKIVERNSTE